MPRVRMTLLYSKMKTKHHAKTPKFKKFKAAFLIKLCATRKFNKT